LGPAALRYADLNRGRRKLNRYAYDWVDDINENLRFPSKQEHALQLNHIAQILPKVADKVETTLKEGHFPLILTGDHSNAAGCITGVKKFIGEKRLGVVWIDAHADLHSPYTTPSGNVHGMPIAMLLGEDNRENAINEPDEETIRLWEELKRLGGEEISPKIQAQDLVYIDI